MSDFDEIFARIDADKLAVIFGAISASYRTIKEMIDLIELDEPIDPEKLKDILVREKAARDRAMKALED